MRRLLKTQCRATFKKTKQKINPVKFRFPCFQKPIFLNVFEKECFSEARIAGLLWFEMDNELFFLGIGEIDGM